LLFSPSGSNHHFIHPERDEFNNRHYSISSQNHPSSKQDDYSSNDPDDRPNLPVSSSKAKWFDAVKTVNKLKQVRYYYCHDYLIHNY
jgi:hypothetical protein